ncbi:ABC-type histidine transport system ATPase subunit [Methanomicrobium sp. W14]|uniref:BREX-3 system P-loop-containing protein BrxF n=1 Tax=Methanomicrobium sp. W14 TaxID=2817839 RepID=UPI001AE95166|nr:BREX-3 system P-loop-containing protein BrxF [Methanomicrobium sp. W14]MBP2133990.1 ABC-type histidine transport system ATPase subunit [Methanomicrobium sp. W14]
MKNKIIQEIERSRTQYNRLILIIGPSDSGKTDLLRKIGQETGSSILNVNLELSKLLLDMSKRQRMLNASKTLYDIIKQNCESEDVILLDNSEILFDTELKIDPLKLLQELARNYCIVATWNGIIEDNSLIYGKSGHPEYRKYNADGLIKFTMDKN